MVARTLLSRRHSGRNISTRRHHDRHPAALEILESRWLLTNSIATPSITPDWATDATLTPTITVPIGKSLIIPLNDSNTAGLPLTYNVQSSNPNITATLHTDNTFIDFHVTDGASITGDIVVELLNDVAPMTAAYITSDVQSGFYNNTIINRVVPGFVIQAGSPNGTNSYGPFNNLDEFNANTIYSGDGQFAMARTSNHDTASTQFFITVGPQRTSLDMNYTLFGQVVSGLDLVKAINTVPITNGATDGPPASPITITSATVITDTADAVITLAANSTTTANDTTTITVTTSDGQGNTSAPLTFVAQAVTDPATIDDQPVFTTPYTNNATWGTTDSPTLIYTTPVNTPITIPISATDITGAQDAFSGGWLNSSGSNATGSFTTVATTGTTNTMGLTVTPNTGFTGVLTLSLQVTRANDTAESSSNTSFAPDTRTYTIAVGDGALTITNATAVPAAYSLGQIQMATFTDADTAATAANFTATINWGNGLAPSAGTVVAAPGGGFAVLGLNTYINSGTYTAIVNIKDAAGAAVTTNVAATITITASHQNYVNDLYRDILGRTADPSGLATWTNLVNWGVTYGTVATAFTSSREYDGDIVDGFYTKYLNRHAESGGLNDWVNLMQGGYNAEQIRAGILGSPEYFADTGGTNTSFVTALYQSFLNRAPDPNGLNDWVTLLVNGTDTTAQVATGFLNSDENRTDIITGFYETYLHRAPDAGGLAAWKTLLANGITQPQIITFFVTAPEYLAINNIT